MRLGWISSRLDISAAHREDSRVRIIFSMILAQSTRQVGTCTPTFVITLFVILTPREKKSMRVTSVKPIRMSC